MRMMKKIALLACGMLIVIACGGPGGATQRTMVDWAAVLQTEVAIGMDNTFPERLGDIDPEMRAHCSRTDAWGTNLFYRKLRDDLYHLISAGPDGEFGNEDDIVFVRGHLKDTMEVYAKTPLHPSEVN